MPNSKANLRTYYLAKRASLSPAYIKKTSQGICDKLRKLPELQKAKRVAAYLAFNNEISVNTLLESLLADKKELYIPRYDKDHYVLAKINHLRLDTQTGKYGILEPKPSSPYLEKEGLDHIDVWLIPGVAFDKKGHRLGFGKGIFDRLLSHKKGLKIGVAYDWQIEAHIPINNTDVKLDLIINNS